MIQDVINHHLPQTWTGTYYDTSVLINLTSHEEEYQLVSEKFEDMTIESIQRIENPYMWGRFKLRKEHMTKQHGSAYEHVMYHPIRPQDITIIREYNCDYRRYTSANGSQHSNKRPMFYKKPKTAKQQFDASYSGTSCSIVVVRTLSQSPFVGETVNSNNSENDHVPEHIVSLSEVVTPGYENIM